MTDYNRISFGKNNEVVFDKFSGVSKEDFEDAHKSSKLNDEQKRLADAIVSYYDRNYNDKRKDGGIDKRELKLMMYMLNDYSKDGNLSKREADKFFKKVLGAEFKRDDLEAVMKYMSTHEADEKNNQLTPPKLLEVKLAEKPGEILDVKIEKSPDKIKYDVKKGEVWYNIVKAKYEIDDHDTVMNVVHQLKKDAGVKRSDKKMVSSIDLPRAVKVNDDIYFLNIDAETDSSVIALAADKKDNVVIPKKDQNPPPKNEPNPHMLDNIRTRGKNVTPELKDIDGRLKYKFNKNDKGELTSYREYEYDSNGNQIREITRDLDGKLTEYRERIYDDQNREVKTVYRNQNGEVEAFRTIEYDEQGNSKEVLRDPEGKEI